MKSSFKVDKDFCWIIPQNLNKLRRLDTNEDKNKIKILLLLIMLV